MKIRHLILLFLPLIGRGQTAGQGNTDAGPIAGPVTSIVPASSNNITVTTAAGVATIDLSDQLTGLSKITFVQVTAPTAATGALGTGSGNLSNGAYTYKVTYVTALGETVGGTTSNTVTVVNSTINGRASLTAIPVSTDVRVTSRNIYRTAAGGSTYALLTSIADNTTTTFADNVADGSLTTAIPTSETTVVGIVGAKNITGTNAITGAAGADVVITAGSGNQNIVANLTGNNTYFVTNSPTGTHGSAIDFRVNNTEFGLIGATSAWTGSGTTYNMAIAAASGKTISLYTNGSTTAAVTYNTDGSMTLGTVSSITAAASTDLTLNAGSGGAQKVILVSGATGYTLVQNPGGTGTTPPTLVAENTTTGSGVAATLILAARNSTQANDRNWGIFINNTASGMFQIGASSSRTTLDVASSLALAITRGGNVLIGTTIDSANGVLQANGSIGILGTNTLNFGVTAAATIGVSADTTAGNLTLTCTSTGNVTITSASDKGLHINSVGQYSSLYFDHSGTSRGQLFYDNSNGNLAIGPLGGSGDMIIQAGNQVAALTLSHTGGNATFVGTVTTGGDTTLLGGASGATLLFKASGTSYSQITSDGNNTYFDYKAANSLYFRVGINGTQTVQFGPSSNLFSFKSVFTDATNAYAAAFNTTVASNSDATVWQFQRGGSAKYDANLSGTTQNFQLYNYGTSAAAFTIVAASSNFSFGSTTTHHNYTVSQLPSAATPGAGALSFVTDATLTAVTGLGLAVTGGGSNKVFVYSDGTNWLIL